MARPTQERIIVLASVVITAVVVWYIFTYLLHS